MSDPLTCPGCEKRYLWKPQYAGRKVKCRCGQLILMPAVDPRSGSPVDDIPIQTSQSAGTAAPAAERRQTVENSAAASAALPPLELTLEPSEPDRPAASHAASQTHAGPAQVDSGKAEEDSDLFELAVTTEQIARPAALPSDAYLKAMSSRPSAVAQALMDREDEETGSVFKEKILPASVAMLGVMTQIILWFVFANTAGRAAAGASLMLLAEALLMAPIAIGAALIIAKMMDISFGPIVPALSKIAAIAIGAGGVADLLFFKVMLSVDFDYQILLVGFVLHMILIGIPVAIIFELEAMEMATLVSIIVLPRIAILYGMGLMFPHLF